MKKKLFIAIASAISVLCAVSCSKSDGSGHSGGESGLVCKAAVDFIAKGEINTIFDLSESTFEFGGRIRKT